MSAATIFARPALIGRFSLFARDIKISHTVFALPWAILSAFLAAGGLPRAGILLLILICMVTARTAAMASNRLLDARLDALNPRTAGRALPAGRLSSGFYKVMLLVCVVAFVATCALFLRFQNPWPLVCAVPVLALLCAYPLLKRFTRFCHFYLGGALALAPVCAWLAVTRSLSIVPVCIGVAVLFWTAGFDIIYACQDYRSDLETGVVSIPARVGISSALWLARACHAISFAAMLVVGRLAPELGALYLTAVACAGLLLMVEHAVVRPTDLSKVGLAFFTLNGVISLLVGTLGVIDVLVHAHPAHW